MKKFFALICVLCCTSMLAQTAQDIGKVVLGVKVMDNATNETKKVALQLKNKLTQLATQAGYSSYGSNLFVISPNLVINTIDKAETGMKAIYVVQGDLSLSICGGMGEIVYSSILLPFKGSGTNMDKAIMNGVLKISYDNVKDVFSDARGKILNYYAAKEDAIFAKADTYAFNGEYDKAIACLMLIPEELFDLHKKALDKAKEIYDKRNKEILRKQTAKRAEENNAVLRKAQSLLSMQNPEEALKVLWTYKNGSTNQNAQYDTLVKKSEALITAEKKMILEKEHQEYLDAKMREEREYQNARMREDREWALHERTVEHNMEMDNREMDYDFAELEAETQTEQQKVDAIKTVACEFLKNNPNLLNNLTN